LSRDIFAKRPYLRRFLYRFFFTLAAFMPSFVMRSIAYGAGVLYYLFDHNGRRTVRRNLAHFVPQSCPEALGRAVRRSFINFTLSLSEALMLPFLGRKHFIPPRVTLHDPWRVFADRPIDGPAILATVHCNWEIALGLYHHLGLITGVEVIALSHGDDDIDAMFERMRNAVHGHSLLLDRAPLASLRALRDGKILGVVGDRDYSGNGVRIQFAGETMSIPVGSAALSTQTNAPIIPCLIARRGTTGFDIFIAKPLRPDPTLSKTDQVTALTRALTANFVRFIAAAPSQWVAFHDPWAKKDTSGSTAAIKLKVDVAKQVEVKAAIANG
jgi:phosphatidylinositol dimannoside acyltransferase